MCQPERIDLHMHSIASDGTDTPEQLLEHIREAGIEMFSLTDHDAFKGCRTIRELLREGDPVFVDGIEFSCRDEEGKYHILGYGYDPGAEPIRNLVELAHSYRMQKFAARLERLGEEFGIRFSEKETAALMKLNNPGKPHIANLMIKHGYAETVGQAMRDFLNKLHIPSRYISAETAILAILASGGVPVLAHPSYGTGDDIIVGEDMDRIIRHLTEFGLKGLEAYYSGFTDRLIRENLENAERYGLYVTAGSDYHGKQKMIRLGETNLKRVSDAADGLKRFVDLMLSKYA